MTAEEWRPVVGFPGYEVSSFGRVRSLDRISGGRHHHAVKGRMLTQTRKPNDGYLSVPLCRNGQQSTINVHRVVSEAFLGPRPADYDTCHNDGDKTNNAVTNLRYDTRGANLLDSVAHGTHPWGCATHCRQGHEYTVENTRHSFFSGSMHRRCRTCDRRTAAVRRELKRADAIETRTLRAA
jgi:hypothetical protein